MSTAVIEKPRTDGHTTSPVPLSDIIAALDPSQIHFYDWNRCPIGLAAKALGWHILDPNHFDDTPIRYLNDIYPHHPSFWRDIWVAFDNLVTDMDASAARDVIVARLRASGD